MPCFCHAERCLGMRLLLFVKRFNINLSNYEYCTMLPFCSSTLCKAVRAQCSSVSPSYAESSQGAYDERNQEGERGQAYSLGRGEPEARSCALDRCHWGAAALCLGREQRSVSVHTGTALGCLLLPVRVGLRLWRAFQFGSLAVTMVRTQPVEWC